LSQSPKALFPIIVIELGSDIDVMLKQDWKALSPILVIDEGIWIEVIPVQALKALIPILVTVEGMVTDVIPEQLYEEPSLKYPPSKAWSLMLVTMYIFPRFSTCDGIMMSPTGLV
jgi:hypothetical protein